MTTQIPNNLSATQQQERLQYVQQKRNWFQYDPNSAIPWLNAAGIATIKAQMASNETIEGTVDYWVDERWQSNFDERYNTARAAIAGPPNFQAPGTFETYANFKASYSALHNVAPQPNLDRDASFAGQRLWGANPLLIERVADLSELPDALAIKDGMGPAGIKLETAVNERRLYICNYADLGFLAGPGDALLPLINAGLGLVDFICQKHLTAPIGLFYWEGELNSSDPQVAPDGQLLPYAVKLEQQAGAGVFAPPEAELETHPVNWRIAKAAFQAADAHAHEWDSHLTRTHTILVPFAVSGERHLHPDHPVLRLMRPHLRYMLKINSETGDLTDQGSYGDLLLAPNHAGLVDLRDHYYERYMARGFHAMANLPEELKARGMGADEAPIHYPYREDGLPIFEAIAKFVSNYVDVYYDNHRQVREDHELQNFVKELTHPDLGKVRGLTASGNAIQSKDDLVSMLTDIIWTAGPAHAAVNYAQWDYMADPRNMPLSGYLQAPDAGDEPPLPNHVNFFPQYSLAKLQTGLMYALGTWRMDMLGHYRPKDFTDPQVLKEVIPQFQCDLAKAGGAIFAVDQTRAVSYPYLHPWLIPNGTSI